MNEIHNINSILIAVDEINLGKKKNTNNNSVTQYLVPTLNQDSIIPPDIDMLIQEAEKYKKKTSSNILIKPLILDDEYLINEENNKTLIREEGNKRLINKESSENFENDKELLLNEDNDRYLNDETQKNLSNVKIKTLKIQNLIIKDFEKNEEKLRFKITDLEQEISVLKQKKTESNKTVPDNNHIEIKNNFDKQIKDLNIIHNLSIEKKVNESFFYKENYERLVIDNHNINKKLVNTRNQIIVFEQNINELKHAFKNLNKILSKNSIIKLNESFKKISSNTEISKINIVK